MGMLFPVRLMKNSWLLRPTPPIHTPVKMRPLMGPQARADPEPSPVPGLAWPEWEVTASEAGGCHL